MNTESNSQERIGRATGQFMTHMKGILLQQDTMDMAEFLKAGETLIFLFLKKRGLLTELLNYPNDTLSLNLTNLFQRNRERSHSNRSMI